MFNNCDLNSGSSNPRALGLDPTIQRERFNYAQAGSLIKAINIKCARFY